MLELLDDCLVVKDQIEERRALLVVSTILLVCSVDLKVARHIVKVHCNGILLQVVDAFDAYLGVPNLLLNICLWSVSSFLGALLVIELVDTGFLALLIQLDWHDVIEREPLVLARVLIDQLVYPGQKTVFEGHLLWSEN